jgi:hypothetical protein
MTSASYETMSLDELRQYILNHRENIQAFHVYIDRSKAAGRMISIAPNDPQWENNVDRNMRSMTSDDAGSN